MKKLLLFLFALPCMAAPLPRPVMVDSNGVLTTPTADQLAAANPTLAGTNSAAAAMATATAAAYTAGVAQASAGTAQSNAAAAAAGVVLASNYFSTALSNLNATVVTHGNTLTSLQNQITLINTNALLVLSNALTGQIISLRNSTTNVVIGSTWAELTLPMLSNAVAQAGIQAGGGGAGGPQSLIILPDGSTNPVNTAALLNSNDLPRVVNGAGSVVILDPGAIALVWDNAGSYNGGSYALGNNGGATYGLYQDGSLVGTSATLLGAYGSIYTVSLGAVTITDAQGNTLLDMANLANIGATATNAWLAIPTNAAQINGLTNAAAFDTFGAAYAASQGVYAVLAPSIATAQATGAAAYARAATPLTNGVAVFGTDLFFPSSNTPPRVVFSGLGSNHVFQGPSAVLRTDGNFLVCGRVAAKGDYYQGGIYTLAVTPDGYCLATNLIYRDPVYDSINATLFQTKAKTLLCFFNLDNWATSNAVPTNGVKWLRSTDGGTNWSTNTLATAGYGMQTAGTLIQCDDGVIVLPFYKWPTNGSAYVSYAQFSADDGVTFRNEVLLADKRSDTNYPDALEPSLTYLGGSNILAMIRSDGVTQKSFSYDGGLTWTAPSNALAYGSACVNCVRLKNGLLLASGRSYFNNHTMAYWTSTNSGASWSADNRFIEARYGWADYSAAVPLDNGLVALFSGYFLNDAYFGAGTNCPLTLTYGAYAGLTPQGDYVGPVDAIISNQATATAMIGRNGGTATNLTVLGTLTSTNLTTQIAAAVAGGAGPTTNATLITPSLVNATSTTFTASSINVGGEDIGWIYPGADAAAGANGWKFNNGAYNGLQEYGSFSASSVAYMHIGPPPASGNITLRFYAMFEYNENSNAMFQVTLQAFSFLTNGVEVSKVLAQSVPFTNSLPNGNRIWPYTLTFQPTNAAVSTTVATTILATNASSTRIHNAYLIAPAWRRY